jgi:hypothetical protein
LPSGWEPSSTSGTGSTVWILNAKARCAKSVPYLASRRGFEYNPGS